jgi:hypothetical protein
MRMSDIGSNGSSAGATAEEIEELALAMVGGTSELAEDAGFAGRDVLARRYQRRVAMVVAVDRPLALRRAGGGTTETMVR